jgi:hypothetical protein
VLASSLICLIRMSCTGPTVGTFINVATLGPVKLAADLRGTFVGASGVRLDGVVVGPRIATSVKFLKLKPYAEFMVGFARYNNGLNQVASSTTDAEIPINGGLIVPWQSCSIGVSSSTAIRSITD